MDAKNAAKTPWPINPAKLASTLTGHTGSVIALAFSPNRSLLASGGHDGTGRIWNIGSNAGERGVIQKSGDNFHALAFSSDSRKLALGSGALNGLIWVFDVSDKTPLELASLKGAKGAVEAVAFSPDGKHIAGAGEDQTLRVWEPGATTSVMARVILPGHTKPIKALMFAPDGQGIATAAQDSTVRLWTLGRIWSKERTVLRHPSIVEAMAFSHDGKILATANQDKVIRLWDSTGLTLPLRGELKGNSTPIRQVLIAADGKMLVSVAEGPRVMNWDLLTGKPVCEWQLPTGTLTSAALTSDGRYLATGTSDGTISLYRVAEKR